MISFISSRRISKNSSKTKIQSFSTNTIERNGRSMVDEEKEKREFTRDYNPITILSLLMETKNEEGETSRNEEEKEKETGMDIRKLKMIRSYPSIQDCYNCYYTTTEYEENVINESISNDYNDYKDCEQKMESDYSICCFCGDQCNPLSQACGRCMRRRTFCYEIEPKIEDENGKEISESSFSSEEKDNNKLNGDSVGNTATSNKVKDSNR